MQLVSEDLGNSATIMTERVLKMILQNCTEAKGPYDISALTQKAHTTDNILHYTINDGVSVLMSRGMNKAELDKALS